MPLDAPIPTPQQRADRLRAYLAGQQWTLRRRWTQQQEDAWCVLDELDQLLNLIQRMGSTENAEVRLALERNGRHQPTPRPPSPSEAL